MKQDHALFQTKPQSIHSLYDAYAGMLLGYIFEVVKDQQLAEDYLVKTFSRIAKHFNETNWTDSNVWSQLLRFAKNELGAFHRATAQNTVSEGHAQATLPNAYLDLMTDEQKLVFCNIYYSKKTTSQLARELQKPEVEVKQLLKEAFAVIRRSHGR